MTSTKNVQMKRAAIRRLEDPPVAQSLFGEVRWAWIWLIPRFYVGWEWFQEGWEKLNSPVWTGTITGFVNGALTKTGGDHPDVQVWYAWFLDKVVLPNATVWSYLVSWGELLVGIALILGIFTGIVAFFGSFMNMSYLLAGSVSINPILFTIAVLLVLAWKTAGWWGLDRWVLPALGTPWRPEVVFSEQKGDTQRLVQESGKA